MEAQRQGHTQRLEEIQVQADVAESKALYAHADQPSGVKLVEALRASVHPVIAYALFILFATVNRCAVQAIGSGCRNNRRTNHRVGC